MNKAKIQNSKIDSAKVKAAGTNLWIPFARANIQNIKNEANKVETKWEADVNIRKIAEISTDDLINITFFLDAMYKP